MPKFYDGIGYAISTQTAPGVWEDVITEHKLYGDVLRNTRRLEDGQGLNNDISVSNSISVVADEFATGHFFAIRYIKWMGAYWVVSDVDASAPPRLILRLGGVYNGDKAPAPSEA